MNKEASRNLVFVRFYLVSAALILGVTAIGKAIPFHNNIAGTLCIEEPILGPFQAHVSNAIILALASAVEFGIIGLIRFCRQRWVSCLACSLWGALCVLVHVISLRYGGMTSCNCLGWFQQIIPLPKEVLSMILLVCAGWLALGGLAAFCFSWRRTRPAVVLLALAVICILAALWWGIRYYEANPPITYYDELGEEPYPKVRTFFYVITGGVITVSVALFLRKRQRRRALS